MLIPGVSGIYRIRNLLTGRIYIGSAINMAKRANIHVCQLRKNKHHSKKLQRAWNKAGELNFVFEVVEIVSDKEMLIEREQHWLDVTGAASRGYNALPVAGSSLGRKQSAATIAKISALAMGRSFSAETRAKMSKSRKSRALTAEHRRKIGESQRGKIIPESARLKMSEAARARVARNIRRADGTFIGAENDVEWSATSIGEEVAA